MSYEALVASLKATISEAVALRVDAEAAADIGAKRRVAEGLELPIAPLVQSGEWAESKAALDSINDRLQALDASTVPQQALEAMAAIVEVLPAAEKSGAPLRSFAFLGLRGPYWYDGRGRLSRSDRLEIAERLVSAPGGPKLVVQWLEISSLEDDLFAAMSTAMHVSLAMLQLHGYAVAYPWVDYRALARFLAITRGISGLKQDRLAKRLGVSAPYVSQLESEKAERKPSLEMVAAWMEACGWSLHLQVRWIGMPAEPFGPLPPGQEDNS